MSGWNVQPLTKPQWKHGCSILRYIQSTWPAHSLHGMHSTELYVRSYAAMNWTLPCSFLFRVRYFRFSHVSFSCTEYVFFFCRLITSDPYHRCHTWPHVSQSQLELPITSCSYHYRAISFSAYRHPIQIFAHN